MQQFIVLYMAPAAGMEEWMKIDPALRKETEDTMKADWGKWMVAHKAMFSGTTAGTGKTKRVNQEGIHDVKNDVMLYSIVEGESSEAVAQAFANHPHFGIPDSWIDIMPINPLPKMEGME